MATYNFNPQFGIDNSRIKEAIITQGEVALQSGVRNILFNQEFYENVAQGLVKSYLPSFNREGQEQDLSNQSSNYTLSKAKNISDNINLTTPFGDSGYLNSAIIVPNLTLRSQHIRRNFFSNADNVIEDEIIINVPIANLSITYSNNYASSSPVGYGGTIKEDIGSSDYAIKIDGVFISRYIGDSQEDPDINLPDIQDFTRMCIRNKTVNIESDYLENKANIDLSNCVIESFQLPGDISEKNIQRFSMNLLSDINISV